MIGAGIFDGDVLVVPVAFRLFQIDLTFRDWSEAGVNIPGGIKGQISPVDSSLMRKEVGQLSPSDAGRLDQKLRRPFSLFCLVLPRDDSAVILHA